MAKEHAAAGKQQSKNASTVNAKAAFKNFSLSKLATAKPTRSYIKKGEDVRAKQKSLIQSQLADMKRQQADGKPAGPGLTLIVSDQSALKMKDGKIDLSALIDSMEKTKQGTQFYTAGTSVIEQINIQNQVDDFFSALKGKNNVQPK